MIPSIKPDWVKPEIVGEARVVEGQFEKIGCDDCGARFEDTEEGADSLWSHCCVTTWDRVEH